MSDAIEWDRYETPRGTRFEARYQDLDLVVCWGEFAWEWSTDSAEEQVNRGKQHIARAAKEAAEDAAYAARSEQ